MNGLVRVGRSRPRKPDPWWLLPLLCISGNAVFWLAIAAAAQ